MSSFTTPLIVRVEQRERSGRGLFTVMDSFKYEVGTKGSGVCIVVDEGFETDFASVPRIARWLISPVGLHAKASLVHDALYRGQAKITHGSKHMFRRRVADYLFLEAMTV